jgi:type VI secretion system protein ImpB
MDGKVAASDQIKALLKDPALMEALAQRLVPTASPESSES